MMKLIKILLLLLPLSMMAQQSDETAFFTATGINATQQGYVAEFVRALKQYRIYESMDAMVLAIGGTSGTHQVGYMDTRSSGYFTFTGTVTHDANGIDFGSGGYLSFSKAIRRKGIGISIYLKDAVGVADSYVNTTSSTTGRLTMYPDSAAIFKGAIMGATGAGVPNGGGTGLFTLQRGRNSNTTDSLYYYKNGALLGKEYNAWAYTGATTTVKINSQRAADGGSTVGFQFFAIHDALDTWQVAKLYACVQALQTRLARQTGSAAGYPADYRRWKNQTPAKAIYWSRTSTGGYTARDGAVTQHTQGDTIIQAGGWDGTTPTFNQIYVSADSAKTWTLYGTAAWPPTHTMACVKLGSYYYLYGSDHYRSWSERDDVWRSPDMRNWTLIQATPGWASKTLLIGYTAFDNKLWKIGGQDTLVGNAATPYQDVWSSPDGITWTQVCASCAPSIGNYSQIVATFQNAMWIVSGGKYDGNVFNKYVRDIYRSTDGVTWHKVAEIPMPAGAQYNNTFVYDDRLYVSYNSTTANTQGFGYLLSSADGLVWRHEAIGLNANHAKALTVAHGGIYETSGTNSNTVKYVKKVN